MLDARLGNVHVRKPLVEHLVALARIRLDVKEHVLALHRYAVGILDESDEALLYVEVHEGIACPLVERAEQRILILLPDVAVGHAVEKSLMSVVMSDGVIARRAERLAEKEPVELAYVGHLLVDGILARISPRLIAVDHYATVGIVIPTALERGADNAKGLIRVDDDLNAIRLIRGDG